MKISVREQGLKGNQTLVVVGLSNFDHIVNFSHLFMIAYNYLSLAVSVEGIEAVYYYIF